MRLVVNGPRNSGNHALCLYLKHLGFRFYPGLFENGIYWRKDHPKKEEYRLNSGLTAWGNDIARIKDGQGIRSHSRWSPDFKGFLLFQTRRNPPDTLVSIYRKWMQRKNAEPDESTFGWFIEQPKVYAACARQTAWDDVPGCEIFDFETLFLETTKRRICRLVDKPYLDMELYGQGHSFTGNSQSITDEPWCDWFTPALEHQFWGMWNGVRDRELRRTKAALITYGVVNGIR